MSTRDRIGFWSLFRFACAFSFVRGSDNDPFVYERNIIERIGDSLRKPQGLFLDGALRHIRRPITIAALTLLGVLLVTVGFYPHSIVQALLKLIPWAPQIKPWMLKLALYLLLQLTALGLGLRAVGRFENSALLRAWRSGHIRPRFVGQTRPKD